NILKSPEEITANSQPFYTAKKDLIFFPSLNAYGAFKYNVVRDIFANNKVITVSDVHIALNSVYFSLDEQKHQNNKKAAYKHLEFLSKQKQDEPNQSTKKVFDFLLSKFPTNSIFDLSAHLINPLIFINILEEYGFLEYMPQFNPWSNEYKHDEAIRLISNYFEDSNNLSTLLTEYISTQKPIPQKMQHFLTEIQSDHPVTDELLAQFFSSMIFSGTHSTSSFLASYIYVLFNQYPHLLNKPFNYNELEIVENEVLRIYTPVQWVFRTVREDTKYAGVDLKKGDTVILFVGAANLDPTVFTSPNEIRFDRKTNHLSFGMGPYACIGRFVTHRIAINLISYLSDYVH